MLDADKIGRHAIEYFQGLVDALKWKHLNLMPINTDVLLQLNSGCCVVGRKDGNSERIKPANVHCAQIGVGSIDFDEEIIGWREIL